MNIISALPHQTGERSSHPKLGRPDTSIRRAGTQEWKTLGTAPSAGARSSMTFSDPDCAFDIQATVGAKPVTWTGVNLCGAKSVVLQRDEAAGAWVDYDQ